MSYLIDWSRDTTQPNPCLGDCSPQVLGKWVAARKPRLGFENEWRGSSQELGSGGLMLAI
jgi:hypothetical protein